MIAWVTVHSAGRLVIADAFFQIGEGIIFFIAVNERFPALLNNR